MDSQSTPVVSAAKLPILNLNKFDLWKMRIEQYLLMIDYSLWEVIINGDSPVPTVVVEGAVQPTAILTAEQKIARRNKLKARVSAATIVSAVCAQLPVSSHLNIDSLSNAVIFSFFSSQSTNPQIDNEDLKQINVDDLEEIDLRWSPKDNRRTVAAEPQRRHVPVETSTSNALVSQCDGIGSYDWSYHAEEEPANFALTAIPSSSYASNNEVKSCTKACSKAYDELHSQYDKLTIDFRKSQFDVLFYHAALESVEARLVLYKQNESILQENINMLKNKVHARDNVLVTLKQKLNQAKKEKDDLNLKFDKFQSSLKSLTELLANQTNNKHGLGYYSESDCETLSPSSLSDRSQPSGEYHAVPPPITGNFMSPKPNLVFHTAPIDVETTHSAFTIQPSSAKPAQDISHATRPMVPIIEDWVSDSEDESEPNNPQSAPSFIQTSEHAKLSGGSVMPVEASILETTPNSTSLKTKGSRRKNRKTCFVCRGVDHLIKDCNFHAKPKTQPTPRNSSHKGYDKQGNSKGGKITGKGKIKIDFKLPDENQVLLRVPRENNIYNVNLKDIVPSGDLTCLFAKATIDESNLWHRRLGYVNFKNINKLVKGNLVRGLPTKVFENQNNCVACMKGKQHRASYKTKPISYVTQPLFRLHMDLFRPTFVRSLSKFEGKVDEGFLVGYSVSSKAFRVFNSRTCIVQETLHVNFLENKANIAGTDPTWLFDIDSLTRTMNYQPVIVGNQSNPNAGDATFDDNEHSAKHLESTVNLSPSSNALSGEQYDMTKKRDKGKSLVDYFIGNRDFNEDFKDYSEDSSNDVSVAGLIVPTAGQNYFNNTNPISAVEADFNNLETSITVSPIPTTRIHNAHPISQIIGHTQEEGIEYEEVFAPVARIEAIRLFLAYASFMGFMVYQIDVKSAFMYETIEEEVYVYQPLGFEDPDHPDKVYKVVKKGDILLVQIYVDDIIFGATNKDLCKSFEKLMKDKFQMSSMGELTFFMGLQVKKKEDGIFINQDKYVAEILKKFRLTEGKSASTPIDTEKPLLKDPDVKRIIRYLRGKPNLGLWYPKDSPFDLVAHSDSDYDGASLDRKSTTKGCQFLGSRLIYWQHKKQTVVATSSTEAEWKRILKKRTKTR
nr:hypothetical protein [Tanacetum cinerariifolium]